MTQAAVVTLCELAAIAINDASGEGVFGLPVRAFEDYALVLPEEALPQWQVSIQPGPSHSRPATLDGSTDDTVTVRLVVCAALAGKDDIAGIKAGLLLIQQVQDELINRVGGNNYCYLHSAPEAAPGYTPQAYSQQRLRDDGIFDAQWLMTWEAMR